MKDKYEIRFWLDDQYVIFSKDSEESSYLFKGTIAEVNAWLDLEAKGFTV